MAVQLVCVSQRHKHHLFINLETSKLSDAQTDILAFNAVLRFITSLKQLQYQ